MFRLMSCEKNKAKRKELKREGRFQPARPLQMLRETKSGVKRIEAIPHCRSGCGGGVAEYESGLLALGPPRLLEQNRDQRVTAGSPCASRDRHSGGRNVWGRPSAWF